MFLFSPRMRLEPCPKLLNLMLLEVGPAIFLPNPEVVAGNKPRNYIMLIGISNKNSLNHSVKGESNISSGGYLPVISRYLG